MVAAFGVAASVPARAQTGATACLPLSDAAAHAYVTDRSQTVVKDSGTFDNLKSTRAETKINTNDRTVDVTLYFNK